MAGIVLSSTDVQEVFDLGAEMARRDEPLRRIGAEVWGPAPAPIARCAGDTGSGCLSRQRRVRRFRPPWRNGWHSFVYRIVAAVHRHRSAEFSVMFQRATLA